MRFSIFAKLTSAAFAAAIALLAGCAPPASTPAAAPAGQPAAQPAVATASQGAGSAAAAPAALARPAVPEPPIKRPLAIARPPVPQFGSEGVDTSKMGLAQLISSARVSATQDKPRLAADLFRLAIEKGADQLYEMACYEARAQNLDRAFYWLQEAALQEGVDPAACDYDTALEKLRADPRWMSVRKFLADCQDHWSKSGIDDHRLVLPAKYQGTPLPVLVWLQGSGGCSSSHTFFPELQQLADQHQVAFLSVSGPLITGPRHFAWNADAQASEARIAAALAKFADKLKVKEDRLAVAGFEQGGQIAGELAAAQPQRYSGALIIFPRGFEILPANVPAAEAHKRQHVVIVTGPDNASTQHGRGYFENFRSFGADTTFQPYTDVGSFAQIPDLKQQLPQWTATVLGLGAG
jgi:predicted esterase